MFYKYFLFLTGYILAVAGGISVSGATVSILIAVLHCCRATRRATTGALALPIPLLPEDQIPLHAEPEHPVPMLSVQSAGCAGMERLGVPVRTSLNTPPDDRGHISRRMRVDSIQARDLLARDATLLSDRQIRNNNHLHHYHRVGCGSNSSSYSLCNSSNTRVGLDAATLVTAQQQQHQQTLSVKPINNDNHHHQLQQQQQIRCPHHVPLPDSEWGQDRDLQIRTRYQQSEITRSYIKPPPNKTVLDVPEQTYNFYSSTTLSTTASSGTPCNLRTNLTNQHANIYQPHQQSGATSNQHSAILTQQQQQQQKSKPSVITKLFSRKSSPKSPTALSSSSSLSSNSSLSSSASSASSSSSSSSSPSSSSVSTSSSSSSLCSGQTLPISTAANLTATTCSLGAAGPMYNSLAPTTTSNSSSFLTAIGSTNAMRTSPSPPLVVTVPVASACSSSMLQQHQFHLQQQQQQQHLLLADSTNSSNLSSTSLHLIKSSSCNLSPACSSTSPLSMMEAQAAVAPGPSIDCGYMQATSSIQRSRSPSYNAPPSSQQQQQSIDNCVNSSSSNSISSSNSMSSSRNYQHHI